jgi:hypothetical protein
MRKYLLPKCKAAFHIFFIALIVVAVNFIDAQEDKAVLTVKIDQIISNDFPNMTVFAVVENRNGEVLTGLSPGLFSFRIDSMEADIRSTITPFAMKELPIDYNIIFSNNGIMEGEPLDFQKNAIIQFIDSMKPADRLSLYAIGEEAATIFEELNKETIDASMVNEVAVTSVQPRLYDSLITVLRKVQRRNATRKIIIIISDGRDQNSRFTKEQLNTVLSEVDLPIYSLGMRVLNTQSLSNLNEMADSTGGTYLYVPRVADIPDNLKRLTSRIVQPYIIDLRVRGMKADNLPHVFEVAIDERESAGKGQKTFIAVRVPVPRWVRWVILGVIVFAIILVVTLTILFRIKKRKGMGITRRRCPVCHNLMKDSWDSCPFCRYLPGVKKKIFFPEFKKKEKKA